MSEIETSMPSRADILSVIGGLEALRPAASPSAPAAVPSPPPGPLDAAQARHDQDAAALRDMTADRDAWRNAAERLQTELWRQMDVLRSELDGQRVIGETMRAEIVELREDRNGMGIELLQQREQVAHLSAAMTSLIELAQSRPTAAAPAEVPAAPAPEAPAATPAADGYAIPAGMEARPATQPPPPAVDPDAPPMVIPSLAPDVAPPVRRKPIRAVQPTLPRVPVAGDPAPEPVAPIAAVVADLPPVVEFTAPEPQGGAAAILPNSEKKRRLRIG
jgi:hypothetical protein